MKTKIFVIWILVPLINFTFFNVGSAETRLKYYEMAESGEIISFPMSSEEIAREDAEKERLSTIRKKKTQQPNIRMKVIEMGESGQTVSFPMTKNEIKRQDDERERLKALRVKSGKMRKQKVTQFELAESGEIIEFPSN